MKFWLLGKAHAVDGVSIALTLEPAPAALQPHPIIVRLTTDSSQGVNR